MLSHIPFPTWELFRCIDIDLHNLLTLLGDPVRILDFNQSFYTSPFRLFRERTNQENKLPKSEMAPATLSPSYMKRRISLLTNYHNNVKFVHSEMKILSSITYPRAIQNPRLIFIFETWMKMFSIFSYDFFPSIKSHCNQIALKSAKRHCKINAYESLRKSSSRISEEMWARNIMNRFHLDLYS